MLSWLVNMLMHLSMASPHFPQYGHRWGHRWEFDLELCPRGRAIDLCALTTQPCADLVLIIALVYTWDLTLRLSPDRCGAAELCMFQILTYARTGGGGACP